jgi:curli biogenesis system outer membrane secretion channel CsgG
MRSLPVALPLALALALALCLAALAAHAQEVAATIPVATADARG